MSDYTYIDTDAAFADYRSRLRDRGVAAVAMDLEGEFNLHVYGERFCLLQLYDGSEAAVVDPLVTSTEAIADLLGDPALQKVTYDSASDRVLLAKAHRISLTSIVDLKPAVEILDLERQDLTSVLESVLDLRDPGGKKRFQQYNWTRRPIDPQAIAYAVRDVRHLLELRDVLFRMLEEAGLSNLYRTENERRQSREPAIDRQPGVFRSSRYARLRADEKRSFRRLFDIRERYARDLDLPPNTVLANNDLFALAVGAVRVAQLRPGRRVPERAFRALMSEISGSPEGGGSATRPG